MPRHLRDTVRRDRPRHESGLGLAWSALVSTVTESPSFKWYGVAVMLTAFMNVTLSASRMAWLVTTGLAVGLLMAMIRDVSLEHVYGGPHDDESKGYAAVGTLAWGIAFAVSELYVIAMSPVTAQVTSRILAMSVVVIPICVAVTFGTWGARELGLMGICHPLDSYHVMSDKERVLGDTITWERLACVCGMGAVTMTLAWAALTAMGVDGESPVYATHLFPTLTGSAVIGAVLGLAHEASMIPTRFLLNRLGIAEASDLDWHDPVDAMLGLIATIDVPVWCSTVACAIGGGDVTTWACYVAAVTIVRLFSAKLSVAREH